MNYVLVPADKAANNVVVVLVDTNASKLQPFLSEGVVVHGDGCHTVLYFGAKAKENQDKSPTLYWLLNSIKSPIKQDLLLTTTELSKFLTQYLIAVENMLSSTVKRYMRDPVKVYFGLLKIQVKF